MYVVCVFSIVLVCN